MKQYAIGVDYGTNSVRALVVDIASGAEVASAVFNYPSGDAGILLDPSDPNLARQNPADYIEGFYQSVGQAVRVAKGQADFDPKNVVGIGVDTTGSTPIPVDKTGTALAMQDQFKLELAAHAWLWKDHTSHAEADEITRKASSGGFPYLAKCGGTYSSEWYWSKILHCLRTAPHVAKAAYSWVELADFVPAFVTGNTDPDKLARGICAAGHKAMYHADWEGLPSEKFLDSLEPGLARFRYETKAVPSNHRAGELTAEVADKVGLPAGIPVAVGAFDAHMGAVGSGCGTGTLVKIMGTSTCDCMPAPLAEKLPDVPGLCGIVPESIMPGMYGLEAGQSAVGDIFNWFVKQLTPACYGTESEAHVKLTEAAAKLKPGESGLVALDWNNGNRTVLVDPLLTGLLVGQTLHTTAAEVYRALIEATAFGALTIINRFEEYGVKVEQVINCGGIAEKNPMVMQIYADVCARPMKISRSAQTCALGAAIFGAVAAGAHPTVEAAQVAMTGVKETVYEPIAANVAVYRELYKVYRTLHDAFGTKEFSGSLSGVMKDLIRIRERGARERRMLDALKEQVCQANLDLVAQGLVTLTWGNVSGLSDDGQYVVIKASGVAYSKMRPEHMVVVDLDGKVVQGDLRPSSDTPTHLLLYRSFTGIGGITHTHSRYATMFAQARLEIPCLGTTHADHFYGSVPVTRPLTENEVETAYEANTGHVIIERFREIDPLAMPAVLVAGHAPFAWGKSAAKSVENAVALEAVAEMAWGTRLLASPPPVLETYVLEKHYRRKHGPDAYYGQRSK